uniref:uncharacterized protein LOC120327047 n=1 Tax=Styela clava TaxID=7725 RepID=UPI001939E88B|nr:uncharacterized protein LOC120327047 [Styela clava]
MEKGKTRCKESLEKSEENHWLEPPRSGQLGRYLVLLWDMKELQEKDQASYDEIMENLHQMIADETNVEFATDFMKELDEFVNMDEDERLFKLKNEVFVNDNENEYVEQDALFE